MRTLEEILKGTEEKARRMAEEATKNLRQAADISELSSDTVKDIKERLSGPEIDDILKATIESFLNKAPKKTKRKGKTKALVTKQPVKTRHYLRLTLELVMKAYEATGLKPCKAEYWFYDDIKKHPLVQVSQMSGDRKQATPMAAFTFMKRAELLQSSSPPTFITDYRDLEKPSHKWTAGRVSQVSGLDISYILGFNSGFDGNAPPHPKGFFLTRHGYEDGLKIRDQLIDKGVIKPDPEDMYADETDEDILSELHRVRGYTHEGWHKW
jgi:hypothetical protein